MKNKSLSTHLSSRQDGGTKGSARWQCYLMATDVSIYGSKQVFPCVHWIKSSWALIWRFEEWELQQRLHMAWHLRRQSLDASCDQGIYGGEKKTISHKKQSEVRNILYWIVVAYPPSTCTTVPAKPDPRVNGLLELLLAKSQRYGLNYWLDYWMRASKAETHGRSCDEWPHDRFLQLVARGGRRA